MYTAMSGKPFLKIEDFTGAMLDALDVLEVKRTLVGIPQDENYRNGSEDSEIGNAALLYINNFGSPDNNIPPRPVMDIGIREVQDQITDEMKRAAKNSLSRGGSSTIEQYYERIGIIASNSIKRVINDQIDIEPPAESTLKSRQSRGFKGTKALVVSGQMRNAITYVVE